jgi:hypothetical protein
MRSDIFGAEQESPLAGTPAGYLCPHCQPAFRHCPRELSETSTASEVDDSIPARRPRERQALARVACRENFRTNGGKGDFGSRPFILSG